MDPEGSAGQLAPVRRDWGFLDGELVDSQTRVFVCTAVGKDRETMKEEESYSDPGSPLLDLLMFSVAQCWLTGTAAAERVNQEWHRIVDARRIHSHDHSRASDRGAWQALERALDELLVGGMDHQVRTSRQQIEGVAQRLEELAARVRSLPTIVSTEVPEGTGREDDLTEIVGLGPSARTHLRRRGVHRFRQITEWSEADVEKVSAGVPGMAARIRRGDWIGQARRLLRERADKLDDYEWLNPSPHQPAKSQNDDRGD